MLTSLDLSTGLLTHHSSYILKKSAQEGRKILRFTAYSYCKLFFIMFDKNLCQLSLGLRNHCMTPNAEHVLEILSHLRLLAARRTRDYITLKYLA